MKKTLAVMTLASMSVSSFAPLLISSSYIANADEATSTTIGDGNSSTTTSTSTNSNSNTSTSSSTTTNNGNGSWWNIPTPPTPPTPPSPSWWMMPGNGTTSGNGNSNWPWWNIPTPPTPPSFPWWNNNGTSTGTTTNPGGGTSGGTGSTTASTTAKVTIVKFIDGMMATASSSNNMNFMMTANFNSTSTGQGTGNYNLSASGYNGNNTPYQAMTINFAPGASYSTYENMNTITGMICATSSASTSTATPFSLVGYTTGSTLAQAMTATPSMATPTFTNLQNDKYVIVWNHSCATMGNGGTIGGNVTGGSTSTATTSPGILHVDSIDVVNSNATADGTFANGFKYMFNITAPTNETDIAMKFADWMNSSNSGIIPAANNMRISSAQANSTSTATVTAANTYTSFLHIVGDLNPVVIGNQIKILVETLIPINTMNGSYTTSYGVKTQ